MPDRKKMEVDVDHTGRVEEVEEVVERTAVPPAAMQALMRVLPKFEPTLIERSTRHNFEIYYEFEGKDSRGTEIDVADDTAN